MIGLALLPAMILHERHFSQPLSQPARHAAQRYAFADMGSPYFHDFFPRHDYTLTKVR